MRHEEGQHSEDILAGFGANERALLERIPSRLLRRLAAALVRTKMRLQFTGWLQYVLPLVPMTLSAALAGVAWLVGLSRVATGFAVAAVGLLAIVLFDLVTGRLRIRLPEGQPARNVHLDLFDLMRARRSCRSFRGRESLALRRSRRAWPRTSPGARDYG